MILDFSNLQLDDKSPIYMQIIRYVKVCIVSGKIQTGDELPSRRVLSSMLQVNPNTIQKACRMMEEEGWITSYAGSKSIFHVNEEQKMEVKQNLLQEETSAFIALMKQMGISFEELQFLMKQIWEET